MAQPRLECPQSYRVSCATMPFHWTCPYCDRDTTITNTVNTDAFALTLENADGGRYFTTLAGRVPEPEVSKVHPYYRHVEI
jgi:hypothetical protein